MWPASFGIDVATAAQLKRLRKKYGLGEFSKKRRKKPRNKAKARPKRRRRYTYSGSRKKDSYLKYLDSVGIPGLGGGLNFPSPLKR